MIDLVQPITSAVLTVQLQLHEKNGPRFPFCDQIRTRWPLASAKTGSSSFLRNSKRCWSVCFPRKSKKRGETVSFFFSLPLVVTLQTTAYNQGQLPISVKLRRESIGIAQVGHQILIATKHSLSPRTGLPNNHRNSIKADSRWKGRKQE